MRIRVLCLLLLLTGLAAAGDDLDWIVTLKGVHLASRRQVGSTTQLTYKIDDVGQMETDFEHGLQARNWQFVDAEIHLPGHHNVVRWEGVSNFPTPPKVDDHGQSNKVEKY